ncbi:cytochrome c biogenesis protein ResB [Tumebacillus avium]|uniref:cytochrome c biogenesis protein ResB n=1 Tax=Tumebacillus avium TaxID=1903704 RepID=UPI0018DFDDC5|nr:cytochrome c biogenesis protein ResB [Tumebacillus avium]
MQQAETQKQKKQKQKSLFDHVWDFFASVRVAIVIIVSLALTAILGTIYPQENAIPSPNPEFYYMDTYGKTGDLYYRLGLSDMYNSWWFLTLVLMLAISLIICSIERVVPLYKSLKNQPVARKVIAIRSDRLYASKDGAEEADIDLLAAQLKKKRYKLRRESGALLAEKGRLPRFGAYIIHIGLLIIIAGVFVRLIPGAYFSDMVWLKEGERKYVDEVGFGVENNGFELEFYDKAQTRVKKYETDVAVYVGDEVKATQHLIVNEPLKFNHTLIFQNSYDPNPMFKKGKVELTDKKTGKSFGTFDIDFNDPQQSYKAGEYTLTMVNYYPDIKVDPDKGGVFTNSRDPYNPGLQLAISKPGMEPQTQWMMPLAPFVEEMLGQDYQFKLQLVQVELFNMTGLRLQKDLGIPVVYTGCAVVLWGLVLCFYFQHRRIWARLEDGVLHIGANTSKNWLGMSKEFNKATAPLGIEAVTAKPKSKPKAKAPKVAPKQEPQQELQQEPQQEETPQSDVSQGKEGTEQ